MSHFDRVFAAAASCPEWVALHHRGRLVLGAVALERVRDDDPARALARFAAECDRPREGLRFGWLGYDALRSDEPDRSPDARPRAERAPLALIAELSSWIALDPTGTVVERVGPASAQLERALDAAVLEPVRALSFESATDREAHRAQLATVREAILDGEVYLVNVARSLRAVESVSDQQIAARIARSRAPFAAMLRGAGCVVGAMSMERALSFDLPTRALQTRPIKGTRPRAHDDPARDRALADELLASDKERAENVMAVDVHRNDLGRVATVGSVEVTALCQVEPHAFVHHLVSTVQAIALPTASTLEMLEAALPVGSVTGAPKRAAMGLVRSLELEQRGLYTGVYGAIDRDGSWDFAVAIRTMVRDAAGLRYGSGGGIVIDSDPDHEWTELGWKERALAR